MMLAISRAVARFRASDDVDRLNEEWERLQRESEANYEKMRAIFQKWGADSVEDMKAKLAAMEADASRAEELEDAVAEAEERMDEISDELSDLGAL
jgi:seryl-tRNA synthetase